MHRSHVLGHGTNVVLKQPCLGTHELCARPPCTKTGSAWLWYSIDPHVKPKHDCAVDVEVENTCSLNRTPITECMGVFYTRI